MNKLAVPPFGYSHIEAQEAKTRQGDWILNSSAALYIVQREIRA
jgi:hypothetical protein